MFCAIRGSCIKVLGCWRTGCTALVLDFKTRADTEVGEFFLCDIQQLGPHCLFVVGLDSADDVGNMARRILSEQM